MKIRIGGGSPFDSGVYGFITRVVVMTLATILAAWLMPGVNVDGTLAAITTALVIALLNNFIRPILVVITLPLTLVSMGVFLFVINAIIVFLASGLVRGFEVNGFLSCLGFSILITVIGYILELPKKLLNKQIYIERNQKSNITEDVDEDGFAHYEEVIDENEK